MFPRRTLLSFSAYLALFVALLLTALFTYSYPIAFAQSEPEALGSISGVVRNAQGDPLPNITVSSGTRSVKTNGEGEYFLPSIPPGAYKLRFEDSGKFYASEYYANAKLSSEADWINVSGHDVTGIDMELAPGGSISVTIEPTLSITNSSVYLTLFTTTALKQWEIYANLHWPGGNKELLFSSLPDGVYRVCASLYIANPSPGIGFDECYDNIINDSSGQPPEAAKDIVISNANQQTITIKFGDITQLQGTVQSATGEPLANIQVVLGSGQSPEYTDALGRFRFRQLSSGDYTLQAIDPRYDYLPVFHDGAPKLEQTTPLKIVTSSRYSLTLTMQRSGSITGAVRVEGGAIPTQISVQPFVPMADGSWDENNGHCFYPGCSTSYEAATGVYTVTGLTSGKYRIKITEPYQLSNALSAYYGGHDLQSADDIFVTVGQSTPNINITLGTGAFEGTIMGRVTANGVPKAGIEVGLFPSIYAGQTMRPLVSTTTDAEGNYRFDGLAWAYYRVGYHDPAGVYATAFHGNTNIMLSSNIAITNGTTVGNIDQSLIRGSTLRGRAIRSPGKTLGGLQVFVRLANNGVIVPFVDVVTDINGNYEINGLLPDTYLVMVVSPDYFQTGPLRYYPNGIYEEGGSFLKVSQGEVLEGIDIPIDRAPSAYLPLVGSGEQPTE